MEKLESTARLDDCDETGLGTETRPGVRKVDYGLLSGLTGFRVKLAWISGHGHLGNAIGDPAVTPHRYSLLELVGSNPGLSQSALADALSLSRPATTLALDFWQDRGCLDRRTNPADRRRFGIYLTEQGKAQLEDLRRKVARSDEHYTSALSDAERNQLHTLLAKLQDKGLGIDLGSGE